MGVLEWEVFKLSIFILYKIYIFKMELNEMDKNLFLADNLDLLKSWYREGAKSFISLIYIDPPFNSKRDYNIIFKNTDLSEEAFKDIWSNISYLEELEEINSINPNLYTWLKLLEGTKGIPGSYISYLTAMSIRVWYMREMLKDTGSFYFHCDPTMSHYIKMMLDYIFGINCYRNEIVWGYNMRANGSKNNYMHRHDTIFYYTKSNKYTFNLQRFEAHDYSARLKRWNKYILNIDGENCIVYPNYPSNDTNFKKHLEDFIKNNRRNPIDGDILFKVSGQKLDNNWYDINALNSGQREIIGYPTQKPEKLLERIILASSNPGDIVADFYLGGGTTIAVAEKIGRNWVGSDINSRAIEITKNRLRALETPLLPKDDYIIHGIPKSSTELRALIASNECGTYKNSRFYLEEIITKYYLKDVIGNEKKTGDSSIDGYFGFTHNDKNYKGIVQVTTGAGKNHFKAFLTEILKGTGDIGVYITFKDSIASSWYAEAKNLGQLFNVDKCQLLTVEDLVDNGLGIQYPSLTKKMF